MTSPANVSTIAADVALTHDIVSRHISYLRDAYLMWTCPRRDDGRWVALERAQEKLYAIDPLVARLGHLRNPHRADIDTTALAEMQIGMALRRAIAAAGLPWTAEEPVFYIRTPTRKEIDFACEAFGGTAVEGKYIESGRWRGEAATIEASVFAGVLTTRNVLDCTHPDRAWAVPATILAAVIDT